MDKMRKNKIIASISILIYLIAFVVFYLFILVEKHLKYADTISAANLIIVSFIAIFLLGFKKDKKTFLKKNVFKIVIIQVLFYFSLIYAAGLSLGYLKNAYSLKPLMIVNNILVPIVIVVTTEILRYVILSDSKDKSNFSKMIIVISMLAFAFLDISFKIRLNSFSSSASIFKVTTSIILPSLAKNMMLTYLTYQVGYKPSLLYRLVLDLYVYLVPIFPDLNEYIMSMLGILLPFFVYQYTSREIKEYYNGAEYKYNVHMFKPSDLGLIIVSSVLICLISGIFPIYLLGIATGSMEPKVNVGDAVIVNKKVDDESIKVGDIIVYDNRGLSIVHRVIEKKKDDNGKYIYITKGDANNSDDGIDLTIDNIIGKVIVKIPYIGYPSVWASKLLN